MGQKTEHAHGWVCDRSRLPKDWYVANSNDDFKMHVREKSQGDIDTFEQKPTSTLSGKSRTEEIRM